MAVVKGSTARTRHPALFRKISQLSDDKKTVVTKIETGRMKRK